MTQLPTGTVTYLFTDVEGSTRLWQAEPAAMRLALARHDELIEQIVEQQGGSVVRPRGEGDSRFAVFGRASDAIAAAYHMQFALQHEPWPLAESLRVRMALHTGEADLRSGDYYGSAVNRCARLRGIAHGGQVVLSEVTAALVQEALPPGVYLRDLGRHRLKDLTGTELVFQLGHPQLSSQFPPLRSLDTHPNNLPIQATALIGRERETAAVCQRLRRSDIRLLTLTGPGGTGKTRLALQAASELVEDFADGVFFVTLAPITDAELVASTISQTLGVREQGDHPVAKQLEDFLRNLNLLLVLDNFEQVASAAPVVARLVASCPRLKVLVSSRAPLRVSAEREYPVPPLGTPVIPPVPPLQQLTQFDAVRLFIERARAVKPDFEVTNETAAAVAEMCVRLDGLPLAIELAAARIRLLPPSAMLNRIENRLPFLTGGPRDLPARQQTLRAAIGWSYDLLERSEQALFRRLAVFVGGFTLEAAEAVCLGSKRAVRGQVIDTDLLDAVEALVTKSLVKHREDNLSEPRLWMLETIRDFALEQLSASGEVEPIRSAHAAYFLAHARTAATELNGGEQESALAWLETEHDNLRAVLRWSLEADQAEAGLELIAGVWRFWSVHGHFSEGRRWLNSLFPRCPNAPLGLRAEALSGMGTFAWYQGDYEEATACHAAARELYEAAGDNRGVAFATNNVAAQALQQGDYDRAEPLLEDCLRLCRAEGLNAIAVYPLHNLGEIARHRGDYRRAGSFYAESLAICRQIHESWQCAINLNWLGVVEVAQGEFAVAEVHLHEALTLIRSLGDKTGLPDGLEGLALLAAATGHSSRAACLWGAAQGVREAIGTPLPPVERREYERQVGDVRLKLGDLEFQAAWSEGRAKSPEEAILYALVGVAV